LEESERGMKLKKVTLKEIHNLITKGLIKDGPTIAAFGIMIARNLIKSAGTQK